MIKILIVGPNWVGDMVMAQSLFITLKQQHKNCVIDVLAPAWTLPILQLMPEVRQAIEIPIPRGKAQLFTRYQLGKQLRSAEYDQVILLPNSLKSALIPFFANIPKRTGFIGEQRWGLLNDIRKLDKNKLPKTVQRFVALAYDADAKQDFSCPQPKLQTTDTQLQTAIEKFNLQKRADKILGLCPGAEYGPAKCWPAEHYAEVAKEKIQSGWDVYIFGSPKDRAISEEINDKANKQCKNFSGETNLTEAVLLMSLCTEIVSNDSGLMHVAAALDKNLIAIYGSSDPGFTPPLNDKARVLSLQLPCSPCFERRCPLGHYHCLTELAPQRVLQELLEF